MNRRAGLQDSMGIRRCCRARARCQGGGANPTLVSRKVKQADCGDEDHI